MTAKTRERAAGARRMALAAGGARAEKQRKRDAALAKGRATQRTVRAIRARDDDGKEGR